MRQFATVRPGSIKRTTHWLGLPPQLTGARDSRELLPPAWLLVIEDAMDGGVMLNRYSFEGQFAGDTWHPDVEEAQGQASFEFGEALGPWQLVPSSVVDVHAFAKAQSA